jgi:starch synthase
MKILFATSEADPFIRTGGLGDVSGALPIALAKEKQDIRVILPLYESIPSKYRQTMLFLGSTIVSLGWRRQYAGLFSHNINGVQYYFIDNEYYFKRQGVYGHFDDGERFAFFSKAILDVLPLMDFYPDIIHCNDWQTALVPVMLDSFYRENENYANIKTVFTIHNIEFQGKMDRNCITDVFGIPESYRKAAEYDNKTNMLKAGIEQANIVTTVSETYAKEIMDPYYAYGLENILQKRSFKLTGIVNGIDTQSYDPLKDDSLFQRYSVKSLPRKKKNKVGLQELVFLPVVDKPLIGMVTRLTNQKGLDIIMEAIDELLQLDIQMVILGTGDWKYENALTELSRRFPTKLAVVINFSKDIAAKIYGGADMFLMPSRFEPCGLSQLIAMRYGTIPIVRETGGLKDTVVPYNPESGEGTGFTFKTYNAYDMLDAIKRALAVYNNKQEWQNIMKNAMERDYSWNEQARKYINLYKSL